MGLTLVSDLLGATRSGSSDLGEIIRKKDNDEGARLAYDLFEDRILDMIGAYWLELGGRVDFAGGIGEQSKELHESVLERCTCLGFATDKVRNEDVDGQDGDVVEIGKDDPRPSRVLLRDTLPTSRATLGRATL
ncbi:hypothetical protein BJV78DRAFT_1151944 [Lactifluus subvellereus]|nr:hypothetical protein BJV78DRAFT_1151944 [Lactifluus subvellereus]